MLAARGGQQVGEFRCGQIDDGNDDQPHLDGAFWRRYGCLLGLCERWLEQAELFERDDGVLADDEGVGDVDAQELASGRQSTGEHDVFGAGRGIAGRMVVPTSTALALARSAVRKTSRGWTTVASRVPRDSSWYARTS
jgi:hypothetical protein